MGPEKGFSRRRLIAGAAGAAVAAAALDPLRALGAGKAPLVGKKWQAYMNGLVATKGPSGVAYGWVDANGAQAGFHGDLILGGNANVAANTCFELGSVTKVFTTLLLAYATANVDGVALENTIGQYLPGCTNAAINATTLLELATYTNCIADHAPGQSSPKTTYQDIVNFLNSSGSIVGNCAQGSTYFYSDLAVGLLGTCLGQALSGSPTAWTELIPLLITGPLNMPNTVRSTYQQSNGGTATGYRGTRAQKPLNDSPAIGGGGALVSTAQDMTRFLAFLLNPSSAPSPLQGPLSAFQQPVATLSNQGTGTTSVTLGWFLWPAAGSPQGLVSKNGATNGFSSYIGFVPSQGIGVFGIANQAGVKLGSAGSAVLHGRTAGRADPG